ncbi:hypothetical protein DR950_33770 [Kitasatospora xanthocidica]|uniref:Uncharacterized protein n=1 Tax=Kitasatospora xanthocidica TaxID=83382 RepID=A0A373A3N3_9ACTN|nr:hypothetical protein [Kitasatospora xanthocidica]RGD62055.1 hypothetical protein DR950_33770 [Kitasatospora xanthocidica]
MTVLTVPLEVPDEVLRVRDLRKYLSLLPDEHLVTADFGGLNGAAGSLLGWPVRVSVPDESGRQVPVVALPHVSVADTSVVRVAFLRVRLADMPDDALVVTVWADDDGTRQSTVSAPLRTFYVSEATGVTMPAVTLPFEFSGATGFAYDEIVDTLGWE